MSSSKENTAANNDAGGTNLELAMEGALSALPPDRAPRIALLSDGLENLGVVERAIAHTDKNECVLIGGVAANKRLSEMFSIMCKERNAKFFVVPLKYSGDQAVMHAYHAQLVNRKDNKSLDFYPYQRTDEVLIDYL